MENQITDDVNVESMDVLVDMDVALGIADDAISSTPQPTPISTAVPSSLLDDDPELLREKYQYHPENEVDISEELKQEAVISANCPGEIYVYHLTVQEKIWVAKVVYGESRGEPFEGQVAVAAVVFNRLNSDDPFFKNDSIYSVITQPNQFTDISWITDEDLAKVPSCMDAVEAACLGWDPTRATFEEGATYFFESTGLSDYQLQIRTGIEEMIIGNHHFHTDFNTQ